MTMSELALEVTDAPRASDVDFIGKSLSEFNHGDVGPSDRLPLAVFLRDQGDAIVAGISGYTAWGWLYVQWLWVAENQRGRKLAATMLAAAEAEARRRLWVRSTARGVEGIQDVTVNMVFDPPWDASRMSEEAQVALNWW